MPGVKADYYLVEANLSLARAPLDDVRMQGFVDLLDDIDALAHSWPGFIAQPALPDEGQCYSEPLLLNVSIWESVRVLQEFTYASEHAEIMKRGEEWFLPTGQPPYVLFWHEAAILPTEAEIRRRFEYLDQHGDSPFAFTFERPFSILEMLRFTRGRL